jgi:Family of unknown function (DUF6790)
MNDDKISSFLFFLISNYFLTFLLIGLVAAFVSLLRKPKPLKVNTVAEALFSYYMLFTVGINNLVNFVFHVFFGDMAAKFIGWEDSPFQAEVGFASLGIGIAGVIAFKASLPFRFATLIPPAAFLLGAAGGHIYQMIVAHNFSPGNVGVVLPIDIVIPVVGFIFLWLSYKHPKTEAADQKLI